MDKEKLHSYPIVAVFMAFILFIFVWSILTVPQKYNSKEQKELAQRPYLYECESLDDFAQKWDAYVSDQFPCRDLIIDSKHEAETSTEDTIIDDVYVLSSDYLFTYTYPISEPALDALTRVISDKRSETKLPFIYVIVPQKNLILAEAEPSIGTAVDENNTRMIVKALQDRKISNINCTDYLLNFPLEERAKFFYKTDFHWTHYGAFVSADYIARTMAETHRIKQTSIPKWQDFIWTDLTGTPYLGDLQKRFSEEVTVEEFVPTFVSSHPEDFKYYTSVDGREVSRDTIIGTGLNESPLDYNKISTYNLGYLRIENPNAKEKKHVLLLKDSYACCLVDYFSEIFEEVNIVDPRAECPGFDEIVNTRNIDLVMMMYHNSNVSTELIQYLK